MDQKYIRNSAPECPFKGLGLWTDHLGLKGPGFGLEDWGFAFHLALWFWPWPHPWSCYTFPTIGRGNKHCFCTSVCLSIAYTANNSRTQRPSVPKFVMKVPQLRCDSHTSFNVKRSKVRVTNGRGHTVSTKPGGHTACLLSGLFKNADS